MAKSAKPKRKKQGPLEFLKSDPVLLAQLAAIFDLNTGAPETDLERAQDLAWEAWDTPVKKKRIAMAHQALDISADCADAFVLLAMSEAKTLPDTIELYRKGVSAGERALGPVMFTEEAGHFWGILETRPYMRACEGLARSLWQSGEPNDAASIYQEMLRLNPGDNQGVRYPLLDLLITLKRDSEARTLITAHKNDNFAGWGYGRALLEFRAQGDTVLARRKLAEALKRNSHAAAYLTGAKPMPKDMPDAYSPGQETEAIVYAETGRLPWLATPGAVDWLRAKQG